MTTTVLPSIPRTPFGHSIVYGVHGSPGATGWKAFYTRRFLKSRTEAIEWAKLPPGAISGEHLHTRTEEIYLILEGNGSLALNGELHAVNPGSLVLTPPGNTHGLRNDGDSPLCWWVIESLSKITQNVINGETRDSVLERRCTMADVFNLNETPIVKTTGYFDGPISSIEKIELARGSALHRSCNQCEQAIYVNHGKVTVDLDGQEYTITAPASFLLPYKSLSKIIADSDTELFSVKLDVK